MGAVIDDDGAFPEYRWMAICAVIFGFAMSFGIGANDVANSFGSSVASKALSLGQAIILASVFEFLGAVLLGQSVAATIRGSIIYSSFYEDQAAVLMYGMLNALLIAAVWLLTATYFELPVSTTHTIIAAIVGFSVAAEGFESVNWSETIKIIVSWVISPCFAGAIAFIFHLSVKKMVFVPGFTPEQTFERALLTYPLVVFVGWSINVAFILLKSEKKINEKAVIPDFGKKVVLPCSLGGGVVFALLTYLFIVPWLREKVSREEEEHEEAVRQIEQAAADAENAAAQKDENDSHSASVDVDQGNDGGNKVKDPPKSLHAIAADSLHQAWDWFADNTFRQDLHAQSMATNARTKEIWETAEAHDPKTERLYAYIQPFTASLTAFAHGANDVANAIAPLSAILEIQQSGSIASKADVPKWILAVGGLGIALGFALFGYRTLKALGFKLTCITPSRGFCIELATALAVSTASFLKIPVSTTQCIVGAAVGAGIASGGLKNVQWLFLLRTSLGWVGIFLTSCLGSAGIFAYCIYSPSVVVSSGSQVMNATRY